MLTGHKINMDKNFSIKYTCIRKERVNLLTGSNIQAMTNLV